LGKKWPEMAKKWICCPKKLLSMYTGEVVKNENPYHRSFYNFDLLEKVPFPSLKEIFVDLQVHALFWTFLD